MNQYQLAIDLANEEIDYQHRVGSLEMAQCGHFDQWRIDKIHALALCILVLEGQP
jgi:hypothetical protein